MAAALGALADDEIQPGADLDRRVRRVQDQRAVLGRKGDPNGVVGYGRLIDIHVGYGDERAGP